MRCRHKLEDRVHVCAWCMAVQLRQVQDKLATAEDERDEAREEKRTWVEAAGKELDAQRREIERLLTERDEAQRKLAEAFALLDRLVASGIVNPEKVEAIGEHFARYAPSGSGGSGSGGSTT